MLIKYLKPLSSHLLIALILKWTFWLDDVNWGEVMIGHTKATHPLRTMSSKINGSHAASRLAPPCCQQDVASSMWWNEDRKTSESTQMQSFRLPVTFMLLPAVRRHSAARQRPWPQPAAQWPCCAGRPGTLPGECFPPASHSTALRGRAVARRWRTEGKKMSKSCGVREDREEEEEYEE